MMGCFGADRRLAPRSVDRAQQESLAPPLHEHRSGQPSELSKGVHCPLVAQLIGNPIAESSQHFVLLSSAINKIV
jgi:hypothetical protein